MSGAKAWQYRSCSSIVKLLFPSYICLSFIWAGIDLIVEKTGEKDDVSCVPDLSPLIVPYMVSAHCAGCTDDWSIAAGKEMVS